MPTGIIEFDSRDGDAFVAGTRTVAGGLPHEAEQGRQSIGCQQARVSNIKRGKISQFSLDLLVRLAARAGLDPRLKLAA